MTALKKHIVYTLLGSYMLTTLAGLSLLLGFTKVTDPTIIGIFASFVAQTAAIIVAIIKAPEYFNDPELIEILKQSHSKEVADLQDELAKSLKDREGMIAFISTKILPDDPRHPLYNWIQQQKAQDK